MFSSDNKNNKVLDLKRFIGYIKINFIFNNKTYVNVKIGHQNILLHYL